MKKYINNIKIAFFSVLILTACEDDEKIVDQILNDVGTGAVLRTIDEENNLVYDFNTEQFLEGSNYVIELEEQDEAGGALLQSVEIFVNFDDNSLTAEELESEEALKGISTAEVSLLTLSASDFETGSRGLPVTTVSFTAAQLVEATGVDETLIVGDDRFEFRLVLTLTNGDSYTNTDVGGPVSGGAYFASPFEYFPDVLCAITDDLSGTHSYVTTITSVAPGQNPPGADMPACAPTPENPVTTTGTVTWTRLEGDGVFGSPDSGEYGSTDMSFGQFDNCYPGRGAATGEDVSIIWDCTELSPSGSVYLKNSVVVPNDDDEDTDFSYGYTITSVDGADMTIRFSNSLGDTGTVVLTREGGEPWPSILGSTATD